MMTKIFVTNGISKHVKLKIYYTNQQPGIYVTRYPCYNAQLHDQMNLALWSVRWAEYEDMIANSWYSIHVIELECKGDVCHMFYPGILSYLMTIYIFRYLTY